MSAPAVTGRRAGRGWVPVAIGLVAFVITLVALSAVAGDWTLRNTEMRALLTAIDTSEQAMTDVQDGVTETLEKLDAGTIPGDDGGAALNAALAGVATTGEGAVATGAANVAAVTIAPWHADLRAARDAYLAHNQAWQDYLTTAADDPSEFGRPQDAVNDTFAAVEPLLRDAVPAPALFDLADRVDALFVVPVDTSDGTTV